MQVKKRFKPELINRLNKVVIFEPLSHDELRKIVKIQINNVISTVANKGVSVLATDAALDVILSQSHDPVSIYSFFFITITRCRSIVQFLTLQRP